jgi:capsular polysaccharide biosynthesis protein
VLLLVAGALVYGLAREPVYTAEARMSAGRIDLTQPGALTGFASATAALATLYSRSIDAADVITSVSRAARLSPLDVEDRLDSTPIADSSLFILTATGSNGRQAVYLVNAASRALQRHVQRLDTSNTSAAQVLLGRYRDQQRKAASASQAVDAVERSIERRNTPANRAALANAKAEFAAARLQAEAAATAYAATASPTNSVQSVDIVAPATSASSDRWTKLEIYVFAGLVAGFFLGAALATLAEDRRIRRLRAQAG